MKAEDTDPRRALRPVWNSSARIEDHLVGIYNAKQRAKADILHIDLLLHARKRNKLRAATDEPCTSPGREGGEPSTSTESGEPVDFQYIPHELLQRACEGLSDIRADDYQTWIRMLWCLFNICNNNRCFDLGLKLAHMASKKSAKYNAREVDAIWASTSYMENGLGWPSLRWWLYTDNQPEWLRCCKNAAWKPLMTRDNRLIYREQYIPHPSRYADIIDEYIEYKERAVPAFDLKLNDLIIEHSPMDTKKTARIVELVLSGDYKSVVIWVNRQTLTRAMIQRLNYAICKQAGRFVPELCFRDYRRPDEVLNPLEQESRGGDYRGAQIRGDSSLNDQEDNGVDSQPKAIPQPVSVIDLNTYPRMVCQMESDFKMEGPPPDLAVIDEDESDNSQFSSSTMKQMMGCSQKFQFYLQNSRKVIFLDAFVCDKTLQLVSDFFTGAGKRIQYRRNNWLPEGKRSFQVEGNCSATLKSNMTQAIMAKLKQGKRTVLFTSNNKFGVQVAKTAVSMFPDKVVLLYNQFTDGTIRDEHFADLDAVWQHAELVIYSPILLAGPSVNILRFDCLFVLAYNGSCPVRDMFQAAGRVRQFKEQTMYYGLDSFGSHMWGLPITFDGVKAVVVKDGSIVRKYLGQDYDMRPGTAVDPEGQMLITIDNLVNVDSPEAVDAIMEQVRRVKADRAMRKMPEWLLNVHVRNTWESYLTHNPASFQTVFEDFLKMTGWYRAGVLTHSDIVNWENSARKQVGEPLKHIRRMSNVLSDVTRDYNTIESIDDGVLRYLNQKRAVGMATTEELLELQKWWFDNEIVKNRNGNFEDRARVFNMLSDRQCLNNMLNIVCEQHTSIDTESDSLAQSNPFEDLIQDAERRLATSVVVKKLCQFLHLSSTHDTTSIVDETVLRDNAEDLDRLLGDLFTLHPQTASSTSNSEDPVKKLHLNINIIFNMFSRSKFRSKHYGKNMKKVRYFIEVPDKFAQAVISIISI